MATTITGSQIHKDAGRSIGAGWRRLLAVGAGLVLATTFANVLIAMALRNALGVSPAFQPLATPGVAGGTIVGMSSNAAPVTGGVQFGMIIAFGT